MMYKAKENHRVESDSDSASIVYLSGPISNANLRVDSSTLSAPRCKSYEFRRVAHEHDISHNPVDTIILAKTKSHE